MFDRLRTRVLRLLRVPHDPDPPAGAPGSVQVFRAARNLYKLRLVRWAIGQIGALVGILFSLGFLAQLQHGVERVQQEVRAAKSAPEAVMPTAPPDASAASAPQASKKAIKPAPRRSSVERIAERMPPWLFPVLTLVEWVGVALYLLQIPVTFAMVRLDYELRWYIVTDRSLRIRAGLTTVQESTMSFANIQQVVVSQGPLQRLLGLADVRVQSAGGGGGSDAEQHGAESLHTVVFQGVDNAPAIRDLIAERLRQFRATGLGDPDESPHAVADSSSVPPDPAALTAARELLVEAQALRRALT